MSSDLDINNHILNSIWTLWYHSSDNKEWDINSFQKISRIDNLLDFWKLYNSLTNIHLQYGMFFLMRNDILPMWEEERNKDGGSWSFKIMKKETISAWVELSVSAIGENIMLDDIYSEHINGITISPKKNFSIIKIWISDKKFDDIQYLNKQIPNFNFEEAIFKPHIET